MRKRRYSLFSQDFYVEMTRNEIPKMLKRICDEAENHVLIVSPSFEPEIYLDEEVFSTLQERVQQGVTVKCVIGRDANKETIEKYKRIAELKQLEINPRYHVIVVDNRNALRIKEDEGIVFPEDRGACYEYSLYFLEFWTAIF